MKVGIADLFVPNSEFWVTHLCPPSQLLGFLTGTLSGSGTADVVRRGMGDDCAGTLTRQE